MLREALRTDLGGSAGSKAMDKRAKEYALIGSNEDIFDAATARFLDTWEDSDILDEIYMGTFCISGICRDKPMALPTMVGRRVRVQKKNSPFVF